MAKAKAEPANRYEEYLVWLKASRIKAAKVQKEYENSVKVLLDEAARCHREYLAEGAKREKTRERMIVGN